MVSLKHVFAGRNVVDGKIPVLISDGKERMIHYKNVGEHPRMNVAFDSNRQFGSVEAQVNRGSARHLGPVLFLISTDRWGGVNIVQNRIGVSNTDGLSHHGR